MTSFTLGPIVASDCARALAPKICFISNLLVSESASFFIVQQCKRFNSIFPTLNPLLLKYLCRINEVRLIIVFCCTVCVCVVDRSFYVQISEFSYIFNECVSFSLHAPAILDKVNHYTNDKQQLMV